MSRFWKEPWRVLKATKILPISIRQNHDFIMECGEACYLLMRNLLGNEGERILDQFEPDPDTGALRSLIWHENAHTSDEYPDVDRLTVQIGTVELTRAPDKHTFKEGANEYATEVFQYSVDEMNRPVANQIWLIFNTPPFTGSAPVHVGYFRISPQIDVKRMQPVVFDDKDAGAVMGYRQWMDNKARIRDRVQPHAFPISFPEVISRRSVEAAGIQREERLTFWSSPPPYSPFVRAHDVVIRANNGARYEVVAPKKDFFIQEAMCVQEFDGILMNPDHPIYNVGVKTE